MLPHVPHSAQWSPDIAVHARWPAPFRAAVVAVLGLAADDRAAAAAAGTAARHPRAQWWRLPPELVCCVFDDASRSWSASVV